MSCNQRRVAPSPSKTPPGEDQAVEAASGCNIVSRRGRGVASGQRFCRAKFDRMELYRSQLGAIDAQTTGGPQKIMLKGMGRKGSTIVACRKGALWRWGNPPMPGVGAATVLTPGGTCVVCQRKVTICRSIPGGHGGVRSCGCSSSD